MFPFFFSVVGFVGCFVLYRQFRAYLVRHPWKGLDSPADHHDFGSNGVSFVHGFIGFLLSVICLSHLSFAQMSSPDFLQYYTPEVKFWNLIMLEITMGYMAADTILMLSQNSGRSSAMEKALLFLHHTVVVYIYMSTWLFDIGGYLPAMFEVCEITNPIYHFRWFLNKTGQLKGIVCTVVDMTFFLLFVGTRGIFFLWIMLNPYYYVWSSFNNVFHYIAAVACGLFMMLNFYWCSLALRKLYSKIFLREKQPDDNDNDNDVPQQNGHAHANKTD